MKSEQLPIAGDPRAEIEWLRQETMRRGANDVEGPQFDAIVSQLEKKLISPEEAVKKARAILEGKQDYH